MLRLWEHPDLHFTFPTIKKAGSSSDYKPVSDDYAKPWHELIMRSPYFTIEQWLRQMGATTQQGIIMLVASMISPASFSCMVRSPRALA
mgnify:CR=1 FL=1